MPRPVRKPKRFIAAQTQKETLVVSTPLHPKHATAEFASPELSPIQRDTDFTIYQDQDDNGPESDGFGFSRVKGIKKSISTKQPVSDIDDDAPIDDDVDDEEDDIYGVQPTRPVDVNDPPSTANIPSSPPAPQPKPKKPVRQLRTSQLLSLLPTRRKRPQRQSKKMSTLNTSDAESDTEIPVKSKSSKKRRVVDKENAVPDESAGETDSEEERAREERRKVVKKTFAEVDQWEMAFETVDLSFSSQ
jgi:hypothetical protein